MNSFLAQVAKEIYLKHPQDLKNLVLVLPSKRAVTFLKNEFLKIVTQTTVSPTILSIEEFIQDLASLKLASNIQLSFEFYEVYKKLTPQDQQEDFFTFTSWSQTVLQDFNEVDRYLLDTQSFFTHLFNIKELDQFHWTNTEEKTEIQKNYLKFWEQLHEYYHQLKSHLINKGIGYQGMIYREANENVEFYVQNNTYKTHVFIGFNALNEAEKNIFQEFLTNTTSDIYWDIDETFMNNPEHDAGLFLRKYKKDWPYFKDHPFKVVSDNFSEEKNIKIVGVPKNVGQAKYVGEILHSTNKTIKNTAVVLGNENLLGAILNSIPAEISKANITSGFPLNLSPFASYFENLLDVWEKTSDNNWYYQDVIHILSAPITQTLLRHNVSHINEILEKINKQNLIYISHDTLTDINEVEMPLFLEKDERNVNSIINHCLETTLELKKAYNEDEVKNPLFLEYLYRFYEIFNQLKTFNTEYKSISSVKSLKKIYVELLANETVDFKGEPLEGLQIMGMLESRNLDFENVILTSVNEGILPAGKTNSSFIPFDLKIAFGLPTYKEKDAIYSYHFYRLLQKAKNIYLLYNTEPDALEGGEKSRLLQQLLMLKEKNHYIQEIIASPIIQNNQLKLATIHKTLPVFEKLKIVGEKGFSPTSLSNYIRNPIDFYMKSVLGIKEIEEVEETIAANTLGTIVHDTLEFFYKPLEGQFITLSHLKAMRAALDEQVNIHFTKSYGLTKDLRGKNLIAFNVAKRYIENFLDFEERRLQKGQKIKILQIENNLKVQVPIESLKFPIYIRGKVDRVEEVDGTVNIIDYKTGKVEQKEVEIKDWEILTEDYKYSKSFQILCYAYMMQTASAYNTFKGGIVSFKNLKGGILQFAEKTGNKKTDKKFDIDTEIQSAFKQQLEHLILEIFDQEIPFQEKEIKKNAY
ncbi:PD-(D/E)XK nuclease family protein [Galbibacter sp. BG1]|uniref:PD-(D/E)XK nuclease family protein n=1 Tax=Galbibacter sp. BG1 TaxID=1170699 RepID=UPI0015B98D14|nr:PD-(D/E)XK nuclease family protein [Galbibacter sp. BG1]QLE00970.1 PD-(D/E)XK nuclease family protein [Galbibacter sp. BG1]